MLGAVPYRMTVLPYGMVATSGLPSLSIESMHSTSEGTQLSFDLCTPYSHREHTCCWLAACAFLLAQRQEYGCIVFAVFQRISHFVFTKTGQQSNTTDWWDLLEMPFEVEELLTSSTEVHITKQQTKNCRTCTTGQISSITHQLPTHIFKNDT